MRSEGNPLDLNNLPEDNYIRDGKQVLDDNSSGHRKKKSGIKDGKDESGKVYECRFCSLKFCKSQALGGHMNRHRQERETETLNRARQLVFSNDNLAAQAPPHLGCCHSITPGSYHSAAAVDPTLPLRFRTRIFTSSSSSTLLPPQPHPPPPQHQPYLYTSPARPSTFPSYYPPQPSINDYYVGHVFSNPSQCSHQNVSYGSSSLESSSYTCVGAPVGHAAFSGGSGRGSETAGGGGSVQGHEEEGVNWQRFDVPSSINRFQDGF